MIWISPELVQLGSLVLDNVEMVAIERRARHVVLEQSDLGPHVTFADVPAMRVDVRILRRVVETETLSLQPGDAVALTMRVSAGASAAGIVKITATVVITGIDYELSKSKGGMQRVVATAVSIDGVLDPISEIATVGEV